MAPDGEDIKAPWICHKKMQQKLDEVTLRHLARVVESSDDAIVSKDLNGIIKSWNRAAARMFGYSAAEAIGQSIRLIIPADRQAEEDHLLAQIRAGKSVTHFETIRKTRSGEFIPISLTVSPILDDAGRVIGASKIARDISDRVQSIQARERLAALVASSDDAIITKDLNSIITSWNAAAERMFGYTADEAVGRSVRMLIPAELQDEEDLVLAKIRAGEKIDHYETIRQAKDGTRLSISLTVSPIRDEFGTIIGASKIARDVTERVRLLASAREHAGNTEKLGEVGAVVASTLDREEILQKVTDIATELTRAQFGAFFYNVSDPESGDAYMLYTLSGASREAFVDFPRPRATAVFTPTFDGQAPVRLDDVTADPRFDNSAPYFGRPTGHLPVRSYLAVPVTGVAGKVLGGLFFGHRDAGVFTEQHERLAVGLASWASVALENSRLYGEAKTANRMKDEFLAVLSHELRTPLNAIVGYARLLHGGLLPPDKVARGLETLERNATWLTQIVEDVLDVSRIVSGKIRLDVQPVELPIIVDNAVATIQPAADAKGVRIQTMIDPNVGPVSGDPGRLQQVVWNLVSNAVKFTPKHGRIQVRLERANSHIEVVVSDTGIGIPADFIPYVFDRFRQADSRTTRKAGGLGLGLAIVRHIVEMHGGTVEVTSAGENKGATFRVCLPVMIVHSERDTARREHPRTERPEALRKLEDLAGLRVLAIDDEPDALMLLRVVLETAGAEVSTFRSSVAALDHLVDEKPDVLVVDIGMPEMDGFELITRIRTSPNPVLRDVPAAALTAFARSEDRTRALRSGFELHLAKPVDPAELVASVATLARRARARQAAPDGGDRPAGAE
ncbi:MAG TPA: PAS domain S-box protein [Vicinamibacterales bacterium]|nr:PAS domain S-box protein [Vicinamibacterales bacterium]